MQKLLQWELWCCIKEQTFFLSMMCAFIPLSCWAVLIYTDACCLEMSFPLIHFPVQTMIKEWKPMMLGSQAQVSLLGCSKLLAALKNRGLIEHRYWWAENWVGHKKVVVANQAQMGHGVQKGCARGRESITQCQDVQSQKGFRWWWTSWVMFFSTDYSDWKKIGFVDLCSAKQTSVCYTTLWNMMWSVPSSNSTVLLVTLCIEPKCLINVSILAWCSEFLGVPS